MCNYFLVGTLPLVFITLLMKTVLWGVHCQALYCRWMPNADGIGAPTLALRMNVFVLNYSALMPKQDTVSPIGQQPKDPLVAMVWYVF